MKSSVEKEKVRLSIQIPREMRDRLSKACLIQGKKVSSLVRESIDEKIDRMESRLLEEKMKTAYEGLAEENRNISNDFRFSDAENLD